MRSVVRTLAIVAVVSSMLLSPGCRCIRTPRSIRIRDEMENKIKKDLSRRKDESKPEPTPDSRDMSVFDTQRRMENLREYYELKKWEAVRHEGLALATAEMDDFARLELFLVLAEAFHSSGDPERADEFVNKARKLLEQIRESGQLAKLAKERASLLRMIGRMKSRSMADLFVEPDGEQRQGVILSRKLKDSRGDDVLEENLPDGARVYFCRKPEALSSRLEAVDRELVHAIQRDPEFDYYYAVKEPVRDARSRTGP
jgi:hypothetical protein